MNDPLRAQQIVRRQVRRRRRWNRARLAVLVFISTTAVVAAAYGIDRLAMVIHRFYDEHHHPGHHVASGPPTHATSTTTSTVPGPARCGTPQLGAVVSDWRELSDTVEEVVTVTNISASPCTVAGYPAVGVGAQNGTPLPAPNIDLSSVGVPTPATGAVVPTTTATVPGAAVTLAHGDRASFEISYDTTCDHVLAPGQAATGAAGECYAGLWLEVTPTPGASPLIVTPPVHLSYVTTGLEVSPFQAGSGPALAAPPTLPAPTTTTPGTPTP